MKLHRILRVAGCVLVIGSAVAARADLIKTIAPSQDTTLFQNNNNNSLGGGNAMFAGTNSATSPRRAIMEFNIAGNIPAGATITGVQLTLALEQIAASGGGTGGGGTGTSGPANVTIGLYDASASWGETINGTGTTNGSGVAAGTGDATWKYNHFSSTTWTNLGGDFSPTASATQTIDSPASLTPAPTYTWGSTTKMVADVQSWLDSPSTNFGWFLVNTDETDTSTFRAFWTRESGSTAPQLQITYTPEPSAVLAVAGLMSLLRRRRLK